MLQGEKFRKKNTDSGFPVQVQHRPCGVELCSLRFSEVSQFVLLLPLHPPILEPDFDLSFSQIEGVCDFYPPSARQVAVEVELLLELQGLMSSV